MTGKMMTGKVMAGKKRRKKILTVFVVIIICIIALSGCERIIEGYMESISEHRITTPVRPPTGQISVTDYNEFTAAILRLIMEHETSSLILFYHDGDDVQAEIDRARNEILNEHPIGAFAVADLILNPTRIVTHYEIDLEIEYKRTKEQLDSIVTASSAQFMQSRLLDVMSVNGEEVIFRSALQITEEEITELVRDTYYQNPRKIVMLPIVTVEIFPEQGVEKIYLVQFGYTESLSMLRHIGELLELYVSENSGLLTGDTYSEVILSLTVSLMDSTTFNEGAARTIHSHGTQNFAATAYGALIRGNAVGEGFAMAFKALADELGFDCYVVLGYYDGMVHAWNIVSLYGDYYHIDVAMCDLRGIEFAFLKTDEDFEEMYSWDRENTVKCKGELTLDDIPNRDAILNPHNPDNNGDSNEED